jgi:3'-phosphoadenosine 5'-phosphosulfate sulfotransferase (PAPS reductase)/FAD synthetase
VLLDGTMYDDETRLVHSLVDHRIYSVERVLIIQLCQRLDPVRDALLQHMLLLFLDARGRWFWLSRNEEECGNERQKQQALNVDMSLEREKGLDYRPLWCN